MGSLKDAIRGPLEDHQHRERIEDEEHPGSSIGHPTTDNLPVNTSQPPTSGNSQPIVHTTTNCEEKEDKSGTPKTKYISGETYGEDSASNHVKDCTQTDCVAPAPQPAAELLEPLAVESEDAPSPAANEPSVAAAQQANGTEEGRHADRDAGKDGQTARPVLPGQHPLVPGSPAPFGQQHMHTQVSLEVVQCHSAATSPMTPPEGDQAVFFPLCYVRPGAAEAQSIDAELQAGRQVEYRSVATAPMTPRTPVATTFPEMDGGGAEKQREGAEQARCVTEMVEVSNSVPTGSEGCQVITEDGHPEGRQHVQRMVSRDQDITILVTHHGSNEEDDEEGETQVESILYPIGPENAAAAAADEKGSGAKEATEERVDVPDGAWSVGRVRGPTANVPQTKITTKDATVLPGDDPETDKQCQHSGLNGTKEEVSEEPRAQPQAPQHESTLTHPPIPGSPAPSGSSHHMHTQVSLEVVQCHSVATSPMTPPDGEHTFFFPNACDRSEMRDAEMQVGRRVEFRSVATAPMTPRMPTTPTGFPEVRREERKEENVSEEKIIEEKTPEEKISEEKITENKISEEKISENVLEQKTSVENMLEQNISEKITEEKISWEEKVSKKTEPMATERATADTALPSTEDTTAGRIIEEKTADGEAEEEEKYEEPVQEVSWDEKGMTWEVYGAVVEVSVLGTAIQKHLEKQVKKQRKQPSLPPPPPLNPAALPLPPASPAGKAGRKREREAKAGRRRRNPFRLLLQNIQQPQCCSRAHTSD